MRKKENDPNIKGILSASDYWLRKYLQKSKLGTDEELQLIAAAYSALFLKAYAGANTKELSKSHKVIAKSFKKIGDNKYFKRHSELSKAYAKL